MYPNLTLQIKNNIASLIYFHKENTPKKITLHEEDIQKVVTKLARDLDLINGKDVNESMVDLLKLARESDETYIINYPEIDLTDTEFDLSGAVKNFVGKNALEPIYKDVVMKEDVRAELTKIQHADAFASVLDFLYITMTAKALLAASELGIGIIRLDDESKNARLQERMALELEQIGVDFIVE